MIKHKSNGEVIKIFVQKMGLAYIKFAQILAMQNYGNIFTEQDRQDLESICDHTNPVDFKVIQEILEKEYGDIHQVFSFIDKTPLGSASISQVHRATLTTGEEVAIKVKRRDITNTLEKDIHTLNSLINKYIRFLNKHKRARKFIVKHFDILNLNNMIGFNKAFQLYYRWILEETNFMHEVENIHSYQGFADSVNGNITGAKKIVLPKVYDNLCSQNVIVMEYIKYPNIKNLENKEKIAKALDSYLQLSFYAMFNGLEVIFHGDPHGGNIYLDEEGNIGFLDMGLMFKLTTEDLVLVKKFFLSVYTHNYEKLYQMLVPFSVLDNQEKMTIKKELENYCDHIKEKNITSYFTDMINICLKYNVSPPSFLFCMAKAFICLNGINYLSGNDTIGFELLEEQTLEYIVNELINNSGVFLHFLESGPNILKSSIQSGYLNFKKNNELSLNNLRKSIRTGISKGIYEEYNRLNQKDDVKKFIEDTDNLLQIIKIKLKDSQMN